MTINNTAYIALGSNMGEKLDYLKEAIRKLNAIDSVIVNKCSSIYETEPVGYLDQDTFLNGVVEVSTTLKPHELLIETQKIENDLGRIREIANGPRTIDLDILLYNEQNIESDNLLIPHPRMFSRNFVVVPLIEAGCNKPVLVQMATRINSQLSIDLHGMKRYHLQINLAQLLD